MNSSDVKKEMKCLFLVHRVPLILCCDWRKNVGGTHTALIKDLQVFWLDLGKVILDILGSSPAEAAAVSEKKKKITSTFFF